MVVVKFAGGVAQSMARDARGTGEASREPRVSPLARPRARLAKEVGEAAEHGLVICFACDRLVSGPDLQPARFATTEKVAHNLPVLGGRGLRFAKAMERFVGRVLNTHQLSHPYLKRPAEVAAATLSSRMSGSATIMERDSKWAWAE
jgi:hypothetical protein